MGKQTDQKRLERLAGLARVWGTVKFFHPFLAYREIDWDNALIETIPKVNAAKSPQDYQAAVNSMLAAVGDKSTFARVENESKKEDEVKSNQLEAMRLDKNVLVLDVLQIARKLLADLIGQQKIYQEFYSLLSQAKGVVFDCRGEIKTLISEGEDFFFNHFLWNVIPGILEKEVTLGTIRYRLHNGYVPQSGMTSAGYCSSLVTDAPQTLTGRGKQKTPLSFIINSKTPDISRVLSGLQKANAAFVVQEGDLTNEFGANSYKMNLADKVSVMIRTTELVNPDGSTGFKADSIVNKKSSDSALKKAISSLGKPHVVFTEKENINVSPCGMKDNYYAEIEFPPLEYRLLALFRFWSVIDNFFPYKNLIGDGWQDILERFIPKFEANKNAVEYQSTVLEMVSEIHDTHGFVYGTNAFDQHLGMFNVPIKIRYLDNKAVVWKILDDKLPVKVGDTIVTIDGEKESKRRRYLSRFIAASTPQSLLNRVDLVLLRGPKDSTVKLTLRGADGKSRKVEIGRTLSLYDPSVYAAYLRPNPVIEILQSGVGYVDLSGLPIEEVDAMFEKIKKTKAVIFDMRGYPQGTAGAIGSRLTDKKLVAAAIFSRPFLAATDLANSDSPGRPEYNFTQPLPERRGNVYRGKVVVLIDDLAMSQAEHLCLFLESAAEVTFIGMPTAGANGDITNMILPGNIFVNFSGQSVRHADGRQLQRVGIQPTIKVSPSIKGLAEGRDEILEAAVEFLQNTKK